MNIISKFTVGSENGMDLFLALKEAHLKEMYEGIIDPVRLNPYLEDELDRRKAINGLNDLSTQLVIVFDDDQPLGYAMIGKTFSQPAVLEGRRAVHLSFFVLPNYRIPEVCHSLWQKCLSVTKNHSYWTELPANDAMIPFLETIDFTVAEQSQLKPFEVSSQVMVRQDI